MSVEKVDLPLSLTVNPRLEQWLKFETDETVRVATGKVEIGQGVVTALSQIAAEELDLPLDRVVMLSGDSDEGPDERYTSSSLSIMVSGASIRLVCAEARALLVARAALRLNCSAAQLSVADGRFFVDGAASDISYWSVAPEIDWGQTATGSVAPKAPAEYRIVGQNVPRQDLPAKLAGGAYIYDRIPDDVVHARMLRQPGRDAVLRALDEAAVRHAAGGEIEIFQRGNFVAFLGADERSVEAAAAAAVAHAKWANAPDIEPGQQGAAWLRGQPSDDRQYGAEVNPDAPGEVVEARFSRPYIAHASLAPSCALAQFSGEHLTIWSHGQGMHPLRRNIAEVLELPIEAITAKHLNGPGCYGHNGADDVALDVAIIAMHKPGSCIRLQWRREEEFGFEPFGPAMLVDLRVRLDEEGRPADWTAEV